MDWIQDVYERLFQAMRLAAVVADMMQETIINEGKQVEDIEGEDAYHRAMREAKTKADEMVQEMLLEALLPDYQDVLSLDVEEETMRKSYFTKQDYAYTLVLDPIDGTLDYLHQKDTWSICSAILSQGEVQLAIVCFPKRDVMYTYVQNVGSRIYHGLDTCTVESGELLDVVVDKVPDVVYKNSRLQNEHIERLHSFGLRVIDDQEQHLGCPDAITKCLYGEALAYFADHRNIRDILMGAVLAGMPHGHAYDYEGNPAVWAKKGRQKEIVFTIFDKNQLF